MGDACEIGVADEEVGVVIEEMMDAHLGNLYKVEKEEGGWSD